MIDKEIERRKSIDVSADVSLIKESLDQIKKAYSLSKVKDIENLISLTNSLITETKQNIEVYKRSTEDYHLELERLNAENRALRDEIIRLDDLLYSRSLSPDYLMQMERLNSLVKRIESLNTEKSSKQEVKESFSKRFCVKENRIQTLLSNSKERVCESNSQKIAQFERDPNDILDPCETIVEEQDSLTRTVRAQIRR